MVKWCSLLALVLGSGLAFAETVEFPDEELATETVLPVFERSRSVLNRSVQTAQRFEVGADLGMSLSEPFYNPYNLGLMGTYHFTDQHAFNLVGTFFLSGLSQYGKQLQNGEGLTPPPANNSFDPSKAPAPKWMLLGNYQFTAYYGKISLSKQSVMNLTLFGTLGAGVIQMGGLSCPAVNVGFGQNFFFTKDLALRFDFRLVMYNGPDATSQQLLRTSSAPSETSFGKEIFFQNYFNLGVAYLM